MTCQNQVIFHVPPISPTAVYTIEFLGVTVTSCRSVWCYRVTVSGAPGLSHWVLGALETCQELLQQKLLSVTRNGQELEEGTGYELGTKDGVSGIKFEVGVEADQSPVLYCIELDGVFLPTAVDVAVKGGPTSAQKATKTICGPACEDSGRCQALRDLLESIALQQAGLAHIINAEGEKIQSVCEDLGAGLDDLLSIDKSVANVLKKVTKLEMVLEFKLQEIGRMESL